MLPACPFICCGWHAIDWTSEYAQLVQVFMTGTCYINVKNNSTYAMQRLYVFNFIEEATFLGIIMQL